MDIGTAVKTIRKKKGLTQQQLARRCGMANNSICYIETKKTFPPKNTIDRLCEALDIPRSYLLLFSITEEDIPSEKRCLFNSMCVPLREALVEEAVEESR